MQDDRNFLLAIVLMIGIILAWSYYNSVFAPPPEAAAGAVPQAQTEMQLPTATDPTGTGWGDGTFLPTASPVKERASVLSEDGRIEIESGKLTGSIRLRGGRIDDLILSDYHETVEKDSPNIVLLSPSGSQNPYFAEYGWTGQQPGQGPNQTTPWKADANRLSPGDPVTLTWDNGEGLVFTRVYALDDKYMFRISQKVENSSGEPVTLVPYGSIQRVGTPETSGYAVLHEGFLGVLDGSLKEIDYDDSRDEPAIRQDGTGGWLGITDKYWLTALIPEQHTAFSGRVEYQKRNGHDNYRARMILQPYQITPGESVEVVSFLFAGAKKVDLISTYEETIGIARFDRAIDWGWFFFLTKPLFWLLDHIAGWLGNFGLAILALTVLIKLAFFQLANKSYVAMGQMRKLQPKMTELRELHKDDRQRQQQELMALYQKEKVNPVSGCLPILIQIPVFFALYKVLFVSIEMRHAPFFGWVHDLSAPDPMVITTLFGLIPWDPPSYLAIGIWPLVMGISMFLQQKLNPQPADPMQAKIFGMMPIFFTFLLASFPVGLVIYWTWNNTLTIAQQWVIMKRHGAFETD